ncbi:MAG TPA: hypothetical protein VJ951_00605 [Bacteroidales bacterium]|nr:hypothetical protein [Bacteroidales bacterium]
MLSSLKSNIVTLIIIVFTALIIIGFGCAPSPMYYGVANGGSESSYMDKPVYRGSDQISEYVSAKLYHSVDDYAYYEDESLGFAEFKAHRSHTYKNANLAYGGFLYGGYYNVSALERFKGTKYMIGSGIAGEANLNIPFRYVDWRILGVKTTILYENGSYARFRSNAAEYRGIVNIHPYNAILSFSFTTEIAVKLKKMSFGLFIAMGGSYNPDINTLYDHDIGIATFCLHGTYKRFTGFAQLNIGGLFMGYGQTLSTGVSFRF